MKNAVVTEPGRDPGQRRLPLHPGGAARCCCTVEGWQGGHDDDECMGLIHEDVSQLRGEADERQVAGVRVAAVSSGWLTPSGAILPRAES